MTTKRAGSRRRSRIDPTVLASLIGAGATLIAAFVGILLGNQGVFVNVLPGSPTKVVTVSPSPGPAATITVTASSNAQAQQPGILHQGRLVLADGTEADLDAPPSDPQWGEINLAPGDQYDITGYGNTALFLDNNAQGVQLSPTTGSSCTTATGYSTDRIGIDTPPLTIGQLICVRTTEGRFSLLQILGLPSGEIVMYVKTYTATST
jgi:hypothetical protein